MSPSTPRMNRIGLAGLLFCAALTIGSSLAVAEVPPGKTAFQVEPGVRQLFLDDVGVEKIDGLKHTMHPPKNGCRDSQFEPRADD